MRVKALLVPILVALLAACGGPDTPPASPGVPNWSGDLVWHSSSVPDPYNWTRRAVFSADGADLSVGYSPTLERESMVTEQWQHALSADEWTRLTTLIAELGPEPTKPPNPGACWIDLNLTPTDRASGAKIELTTSPGDENYATVVAIYELLAGPDDVQLPEHSSTCPTK